MRVETGRRRAPRLDFRVLLCAVHRRTHAHAQFPLPPCVVHLVHRSRRASSRHAHTDTDCQPLPIAPRTPCAALPQVMEEVSLLKVAGKHPNVVSLQAFFEDQEAFYIVMEMCEGGELYHRLADKVKGGMLTQGKVKVVLLLFCGAVVATQETNIHAAERAGTSVTMFLPGTWSCARAVWCAHVLPRLTAVSGMFCGAGGC